MKPPVGGPNSQQGPPSNCNNGGQAVGIKSETDSFLDSFDSKDGVKEDCGVGGFPLPEDFKEEGIKLDGHCDFGNDFAGLGTGPLGPGMGLAPGAPTSSSCK